MTSVVNDLQHQALQVNCGTHSGRRVGQRTRQLTWVQKSSWKVCCSCPACTQGCSLSTNGPISSSTSGFCRLECSSRAFRGPYVRSSEVVKGPVATVMDKPWGPAATENHLLVRPSSGQAEEAMVSHHTIQAKPGHRVLATMTDRQWDICSNTLDLPGH